jgi:hypothetical protein
MNPRRLACSESPCGKGTQNGEAARASKYGWAPCVLDIGHSEPCDSGPAPETEPARKAA